MSAVSETIVREYFELHGFLVRQDRKFVAPRGENEEIDFFVLNPTPQKTESPLPFVLSSENLSGIERAIVVVKGWHTETFSTAVLAHAPQIFRFVSPATFRQAEKKFGQDGAITKILILPALPQNDEARTQSIEVLRGKGIDAVIPFQVLLADLVSQVEINRNYQKSDLLQIIRVLKNYDFFREPQLELFKTKRKRKSRS